jgi:glycosyltransferase involved in cell wall biosynthesis
MIQHGVSIIICCHNGVHRLAETVRHIAEQKVPSHIPWEFILVDNASTDNSVALAEAIWTAYDPAAEFRVVKESTLGLSHARTKGFEEAQYEFMIMCDDDNWLAEDYVKRTYEIMSAKSSIAALGGFGKLIFEADPPKWIAFSNIFAAGPQADCSGKVLKSRLYGAGCVIRKSAYLKLRTVGYKSFLSDRKGAVLSSGGDYELCYALAIMGYDIWYDEHLRFDHFITKERLTWEYFIRYARESSMCFDVLTSYKMIATDMAAHKLSLVVIARDLFFCLRTFLKINVRRLLTKSDSTTGKILYFKHVVFLNKLISYFDKYKAMVKNHSEIMKFKAVCQQAQAAKTAAPAFAEPRYRAIFSLRLFRLLQ